MKTAYSYTMLRYGHGPVAGEGVNVGVALLAPDRRYVGARFRSRLGRHESPHGNGRE